MSDGGGAVRPMNVHYEVSTSEIGVMQRSTACSPSTSMSVGFQPQLKVFLVYKMVKAVWVAASRWGCIFSLQGDSI